MGHSLLPHSHNANYENTTVYYCNEVEIDNSFFNFFYSIFSKELGEEHLEHFKSERNDVHLTYDSGHSYFLVFSNSYLQFHNDIQSNESVYFHSSEYTSISIQHYAELLGNYSFPAPPFI
jgi:hypothetical protein